MSLSFAVQKAVYAALVGPLAALSPPTAIVDHAVEDQAFPFVELSRVFLAPDHELAHRYTRYQLALTVFSTYRGQKQVLDILDAIDAALDDATLSLEQGTSVLVTRDRADTARDADGVTYTGSALYTLLVRH